MPLTDAELQDRLNRRQSPSGAWLGLRVVALSSAQGTVTIACEARQEHCNARGRVQGGILCAMMDEAVAMAALVKSGKRIAVPTLELKTSFFEPALMGPLRIEAHVVRMGKRHAFTEANVYDSDNKLLARMSSTAMIRNMDEAPLLVDAQS